MCDRAAHRLLHLQDEVSAKPSNLCLVEQSGTFEFHVGIWVEFDRRGFWTIGTVCAH
jgi:hypothetical protein